MRFMYVRHMQLRSELSTHVFRAVSLSYIMPGFYIGLETTGMCPLDPCSALSEVDCLRSRLGKASSSATYSSLPGGSVSSSFRERHMAYARLGGTCDGDQDWFMSQGQSIVFNPESTGTAVFTVVQEQTVGFDPRPTTIKVSLAAGYEIFTDLYRCLGLVFSVC